jgi:hypothetical protein
MFSAQRVKSVFGAQMEMCGAGDRRGALRRYSRVRSESGDTRFQVRFPMTPADESLL